MSSFVHANTFHAGLVLNYWYHPTSFQYPVPAPFREFFGVFDIVANESFGVVTRKMTGFYPAASEKHLEGTFNLYIYVTLII
jgi:hypothetical protein